ncbi:MAG: hypothetical protein H6977_14585 [Gammaproteobacteria bacterium]|nr:hypothetical protein [Gammaproteobacteria bacterium]
MGWMARKGSDWQAALVSHDSMSAGVGFGGWRFVFRSREANVMGAMFSLNALEVGLGASFSNLLELMPLGRIANAVSDGIDATRIARGAISTEYERTMSTGDLWFWPLVCERPFAVSDLWFAAGFVRRMEAVDWFGHIEGAKGGMALHVSARTRSGTLFHAPKIGISGSSDKRGYGIFAGAGLWQMCGTARDDNSQWREVVQSSNQEIV